MHLFPLQDEIEAESAKGETQSANLFGAGDSTKFETAFQFGPSFNAGNNVNSSVFASPPGKGDWNFIRVHIVLEMAYKALPNLFRSSDEWVK